MIGQQIGKYRIVSELGRGGMGVVYKAMQTTLNRTVCIKVLSPHLAGSGEYLARFEREAESLARVAHENIVHIYDVENFDGRQCIVMEYVGGPSLTQLLAQRGRLAAAHARDVAYALAGALSVAHRKGIVHRDIKPDNILFSLDGTPKLTDFGIARMRDSKVKTQTGLMLGTPYYMSPEQARGGSVGPASDLYSLAVVMFEMLTGRLPFLADDALAIALQHIQAKPPRIEDLAPDVPRDLAKVVHRALEKDPSQRYASMDEFRTALAALSLGATLGAALAREAVAPALAQGGAHCPECQAAIEPDWLTCPSCALAIRQKCTHCGRLFDPLAEACPSCRTPATPAPAPAAVMPSVPVPMTAVPAGGAGVSDTMAPVSTPPPDPEPADRIRQAAAAAAAVVGDAGSAIADAGSALVDAARGVPLPSRTFVGRAVGRFSTLAPTQRKFVMAVGAVLLLAMVAAAMQLGGTPAPQTRSDTASTFTSGGAGPMYTPNRPSGRRDGPAQPQNQPITPEQANQIAELIGDTVLPPVTANDPVRGAVADSTAVAGTGAGQPPPPADVKESPEAAARRAIESVVERQRRATETGDVEMFLRDMDPELAEENLEGFQAFVRDYRDRRSRITNIRIEFDDVETASVTFHVRLTGVRGGRTETLYDGPVEWVLERDSGRWLIVWSS